MPFLGSISPEVSFPSLYPSPPMTRPSSIRSGDGDRNLALSTAHSSGSSTTSLESPQSSRDYSSTPSTLTAPASLQSERTSFSLAIGLERSQNYPYQQIAQSPFYESGISTQARRDAPASSSRASTGGKPLVSCEPCKKAHLKCQDKRPCDRCIRSGKESRCIDVVHKDRGRPPKDPKKIEARAAARVATMHRHAEQQRQQGQQQQAPLPLPYQPEHHGPIRRLEIAPYTRASLPQKSPSETSSSSSRPNTSHAPHDLPLPGPQFASITYSSENSPQYIGYRQMDVREASQGSHQPQASASRSSYAPADPWAYRQESRMMAHDPTLPPQQELYRFRAGSEGPQERMSSSRDPGRMLPLIQTQSREEALRLPLLRSTGSWGENPRGITNPEDYSSSPSISGSLSSPTHTNSLSRVSTRSPQSLYTSTDPTPVSNTDTRWEAKPLSRSPTSAVALSLNTRPISLSSTNHYSIAPPFERSVRNREPSISNSGPSGSAPVSQQQSASKTHKKRRKIELKDIVD